MPEEKVVFEEGEDEVLAELPIIDRRIWLF